MRQIFRAIVVFGSEGGRPVSTISLPGGDEAKSWGNLEKLVNWAFESGTFEF